MDFDLKGPCAFNEELAKQDRKADNAKLLLDSMGIVGNPANRIQENQFEIKYNIEYVFFGCYIPEQTCIESYNRQMFKLLDRKYGKKWRRETRYDVAFLDEKDVDYLVEKFKQEIMNRNR